MKKLFSANREIIKKGKTTSFYLFILVLFHSCSLYQPTTPIPTVFHNQKDLHLSVSVSATEAVRFSPFVFSNIAYSPLKYTYAHAEGGINLSALTNKMRYNYSGGLGLYYPFNEKLQIEGQVSIGNGEFDWGDPLTGSSTSFTEGVGDYEHINGLIAINYEYEKGTIIGLAYRMNQIEVYYDEANVDYLNTSTHLINQSDYFFYIRDINKNKKLNFFTTIGIAFNDGDFDYYPYTQMIYTRVGFVIGLKKR